MELIQAALPAFLRGALNTLIYYCQCDCRRGLNLSDAGVGDSQQ
ncbi:hypothetical protein [Thermosynechococcus sp. PKX95]|nr:hypothetical protein [Thermosynechococcus sp. PKX95]WNC32806.1 hypothetical protein RHH81_01505 [Thermosynechococcus sp. PKX95]